MIATPDIEKIIGAEAVDPDNDRIGKVSQIYVDADTDQPTWASVRTGLFGLSESLIPLSNATWDNETLHVGVQKAQVKDAPRVDPEAEISPDEQERLYDYYGMASVRMDRGSTSSTGGPIGAGQVDLDRGGMAGGGTSRNDTDADRVDGYDAATMSDTGYGAGAGLAGAGAGMGTAGAEAGRAEVARGGREEQDLSGMGRAQEDRGAGSPSEFGNGPAGPRFDRGQSREADERRHPQTDAGYGEVADEPEGPDVRGSGRTAGDGRGSGDFASTGMALAEENPVAEEAAEGTGSGYGTSEDEDISGRFLGDRGDRGTRAEMQEAGATPAHLNAYDGEGDLGEYDRNDDLGGQGMPGTAGGIAGAGTDAAPQQGSAGGQRPGGMRLRRYVVRQETVMVPVDEMGDPMLEPRGVSADDSSVGMRMDDQDPQEPGRR